MNFRGVLIRLKPSEVIELETIYAVNIIDLMMEILPYYDPHDVPWFESFSYFEPTDLDNEFMEQEAAKGKGAFVQALWTQWPRLHGTRHNTGNSEMRMKTGIIPVFFRPVYMRIGCVFIRIW
ncbi:hypothetical protein TNCV_2431231 [Trichonephila clavipes]|nr:hypothetical protein TNCV_2431231 [Trichonephila clavipes]